jgi:hypothetical protein
MPRPTPWTEG